MSGWELWLNSRQTYNKFKFVFLFKVNQMWLAHWKVVLLSNTFTFMFNFWCRKRKLQKNRNAKVSLLSIKYARNHFALSQLQFEILWKNWCRKQQPAKPIPTSFYLFTKACLFSNNYFYNWNIRVFVATYFFYHLFYFSFSTATYHYLWISSYHFPLTSYYPKLYFK